MPNIKFSNMDTLSVRKLSAAIGGELAKAIGCPAGVIAFIACAPEGSAYCCGEAADDTVFVNIEWFDRGQEVKDAVAKIITDAVLNGEKWGIFGFNTVNVAYIDSRKSDYYINGEHF